MGDMIERAAKAIGDEQCRRDGVPPQDIEPSERMKAVTRAALLAALDAAKGDPRLARFHGVADQVIDELKAMAQGGQS